MTQYPSAVTARENTHVLVIEGPPAYGRAPRGLLRDPSISPQAKALWTLLEDFASPGSPQPFPGQATLAGYLGATVRTVRRWMTELVDGGWLTIATEATSKGKRNRYTLSWTGTPVSSGEGVGTSVSGGVGTPMSAPVRTPVSAEEEPEEEEPFEVSSQSGFQAEPDEWAEERRRPSKVPTMMGEWSIVQGLASQGNQRWSNHPDLSPMGRRVAARVASAIRYNSVTDARVAFVEAWKAETATVAERVRNGG